MNRETKEREKFRESCSKECNCSECPYAAYNMEDGWFCGLYGEKNE